MQTYSNVFFYSLLSSFVELFIQSYEENFLVTDPLWEKQLCIATYNAWSYNECILHQKSLYPTEPDRTCWVNTLSCEIRFEEPLVRPFWIKGIFVIFLFTHISAFISRKNKLTNRNYKKNDLFIFIFFNKIK